LIKKTIDIFFNTFNSEVFDFFNGSKKLMILPSRGNWACAIPHTDRAHLILIYPDLIDLLKSNNFRQGLAILAHEVGHIFLGHSDRKIDPEDAQFEADYFSNLLGFGVELILFLSVRPECDKRYKRLLELRGEEMPPSTL